MYIKHEMNKKDNTLATTTQNQKNNKENKIFGGSDISNIIVYYSDILTPASGKK